MARVKGLDDIKRQLKQFGSEGERMAKAVVSQTLNDIRSESVTLAPANYGKLRQSIVVVLLEDGFKGTVEVGESYGAFVEFGTGTYVQVPAELQEEALKFKGTGGRRGGGGGNFENSPMFKAILDWVKKKGIAYGATFSVKTRKRTGNKQANEDADKQAAFVIAMSILKKGIRPHPYLYPAYLKYKNEFPKRLEAGLQQLVAKNNS